MSSNEHTTTSRRGWRGQAACRPGSGIDPELFFPAEESRAGHEAQVAQAKAVCGHCAVRAACLTEAMARIPFGVAGGLDERERHALRRAGRDGSAARAEAARAQLETEADAVLRDGPRSGLPARPTAQKRARVGRTLSATGPTADQVAHTCQVTTRTAQRWATATSAAATSAASTSAATPTGDGTSGTSTSTSEGSPFGNRAPLGISTARHARAGGTAAEGERG